MTDELTNDLGPLRAEWLRTLTSNRHNLSTLKPLWTNTVLTYRVGQAHLVESLWHSEILHIHAGFYLQTAFDGVPDLAPIEIREMMTRVLAHAYFRFERKGLVDWPRQVPIAEERLAIFLKCLPTNDLDPAVRWRKMGMLFERTALPYSELEDRPICGICHNRVATGAGAMPDTMGIGSSYRPNIHNECYRYAKLVMLPVARAQRQRELQQQTAEADK